MTAVCSKCGTLFETTQEEAYTPGRLCLRCWREVHDPMPGPPVPPDRAEGGD